MAKRAYGSAGGHHAGHEKEPPDGHDKVHPIAHSHSARPKTHLKGMGGRKRGRKR